MEQSGSILIAGVGGQGTLLASRVLGGMFVQKGFDVKVSEVHGMSQRGGSVVTYVKYGPKVYSPVIEKAEADVILAFEQCEGARWLPYLKKGGKMIMNTQTVAPLPVITGQMQYPQDLPDKLRRKGVDLVAFNALALAEKAGTAKAVNLTLIGTLSKTMPFSKEDWHTVIADNVPARFMQVNLDAFELGRAV